MRRLYAAVVGHSALRAAAEHLAATPPRGANPFAGAATGQALPFGVPDAQVDVRIDATDHLPAKIVAMRAHHSQMHPQGWFFALATRPGSLMGHESYALRPGRRWACSTTLTPASMSSHNLIKFLDAHAPRHARYQRASSSERHRRMPDSAK